MINEYSFEIPMIKTQPHSMKKEINRDANYTRKMLKLFVINRTYIPFQKYKNQIHFHSFIFCETQIRILFFALYTKLINYGQVFSVLLGWISVITL